MKKNYFLTFFILFACLFAGAQVTNDGEPLSWSKASLKNSSSITMDSFDLVAIQKEDAINDLDRTKPWRFGQEFSVNLGMDNAGTWDELDNGDRIWRLNIVSPGAKTLNFIFDTYRVPDGASVYLYNNDRSDLLGAYTNVLNREDEMLGTWLVEGDNVWIEYHEPKNVQGQGRLNVGKVVHGYRSTTDSEIMQKALNDSGNCNQDVDCGVGADYDALKERLKHSVAFIIMQGFVCTGQLINNTNNDKAPYFLTANHCNAGPTSTWSFRFNWISPNPVCATSQNSTDAAVNQTTSGATNLVNNSGSDVRLLELTGGLDPSWDLEWAGWDRTDDTPSFTVGIHHPSGDIMKICRDDDPMLKTTYAGAQVWYINDGASGGWDIGVTEGGSSGSALFDEDGRIVGQLFAGQAACAGTNDNGSWDVYGRFATSWNSNNLGQWLDPTSTGVTTFNMYSQVLSTTEEEFRSSLDIYPNPSSGILNITNRTNSKIEFVVYSILGKSIKTGTISDFNNEIDLSGFNNGIYIVKLSQNNSSIYKKIILSK